MPLLNSARAYFYYAFFSEIALVGVAAFASLLLKHAMFADFFWRQADAGWGLVATGPMLAGFGWLLNSRAGFAIELRSFFESVVRPLFGRCSLAQLALISAAAGLGEEVLFRGVLQGGVSALAGTWVGLAVASVAFGLAHPISKTYVIVATGIGFFLGVLFMWTGNLLVPMVAHAAYDFCALVWLLRLRSARAF